MTMGRLTCSIERRRDDVRRSSRWNGIDYLEIDEDQLRLCVRFLDKAPDTLEVGNVVIEGGERIRNIQVVGVSIRRHADPEIDDCLEVVVDRAGDFSVYTLKLVDTDEEGKPTDHPLAGFDDRYAQIDFTFKAGCPSTLDCATVDVCPPEPREAVQLNYLAKDYESFRQLVFDRIALVMPEWRERHVPDLALSLIEILAYVGDHLSYHQDSVATEAYLSTARKRISVRRHARLVDYVVHEGCNARTWIALTTDTDLSFERDSVCFLTSPTGGQPITGLVSADQLERLADAGAIVFEPLLERDRSHFDVVAAHNAIRIYTWGDEECCLPIGSTSAVLRDHVGQPSLDVLDSGAATDEANGSTDRGDRSSGRVLKLRPGDVVIFEEVKGAITGQAADADIRRRHAVRLTRVRRILDPLYGDIPLLEIHWGVEDALTLPVCISSRGEPPDCALIEDVSIVRGNVVLVDHGRTLGPIDLGTIEGEAPTYSCDECASGQSEQRPRPFAAELPGIPITFAEPLPIRGSATDLVPPVDAREPAAALPQVFGESRTSPETPLESWTARFDLLASEPGDRDVMVEVDDDARAHLRFGDGVLGNQPSIGTSFQATYRVGSGESGNVGPDTIKVIVDRRGTASGAVLDVRNPLPAIGGIAPETLEEVRNLAPHAYRRPLVRAVIAPDYATIAQTDRRLQGAAAVERWTGSWYEMRVGVDPLGGFLADRELLEEIRQRLYPPRRIGHDLRVVPAKAVPLDLGLEICVEDAYLRGHVEAELLEVFSNRRLPDGRIGFFHPDNLRFGAGVYLSAIVAAAQRVTGVRSVTVTRLERLFEGPAAEIEAGVLTLGPTEIAQLDNDRSFPERGLLTLALRGGR